MKRRIRLLTTKEITPEHKLHPGDTVQAEALENPDGGILWVVHVEDELATTTLMLTDGVDAERVGARPKEEQDGQT